MSSEANQEKPRQCAWCGEVRAPQTRVLQGEHGDIREYNCGACGRLLGAYLTEAGDFLPRIRSFENA